MDKTTEKATNASSTPKTATISAMSKMMAMQASVPDLIVNLKLMGVNLGESVLNPMVSMMLIQGIETAIEKSGKEKAINAFNTAALMSGKSGKIDPTMLMLMNNKDGKIDPMTMMMLSGNKSIDPTMLMLMNSKGGDTSSMLPLLMMNGGLDKFKDNPMMLSMLMGGKMDPQTLMMMQFMGKGKDGAAKGGLFA